MKLEKFKIILLGFFLAIPLITFADPPAPVTEPIQRVYTLFGPIDNTGTVEMLNVFVEGFMKVLYSVSISLAVLMIIVSGFQYMTAGADEKAIKAARERLEYAITGLIIVITSTLIYSQIFKFMY